MGMARTFSAQPGTLPYFNYVADKFNFRPEIQFISRVAAAHLDGSATRWTVTLEDARTSARDYEFDMLIYATRFDGVTGPYDRIDIRGPDQPRLKVDWAKCLALFYRTSRMLPQYIHGVGAPHRTQQHSPQH